MTRAIKGIAGICLCHLFFLLCQWASATPVESRCTMRSKYEKFWEPVNDLANKIVSILFRAATFAFHWIPGLQAAAVGPPVVAEPVDYVPPPVPGKAAAGYSHIKRPAPVDKAYFKYDYQD